MPSNRAGLQTLRNLISEAKLILETTPPLPENRTVACLDSIRAALAIADDLLRQTKVSAAAVLGHQGGTTTARKHGPEHFRQMAAARKTRAGGRPRSKPA